MKLTRVELLNIASAIETLEKGAFETPEIVVGDLRVALLWGQHEGQRGAERMVWVTGVRLKAEPGFVEDERRRWDGDHPGRPEGLPYQEQ
jgi:hypothetical protein